MGGFFDARKGVNMLVLILFWVALVLAVLSWLGAVAEERSLLMWASVLFVVVAFAASVADRVPGL